ncbi:MAG: histidine kinase N-terminal 7TM domain-containing protein [Caldilineaceae bacterium]
MSVTSFLTSLNVLVSSVVAIIAFSLLAYTLTYNFRNTVARRYAVVLLCVMVVYSCDVALDRVVTAESAGRWLRMQWLGIAGLPAADYLFSLAVLATTNYRIGRRRWIAWGTVIISTASAIDALAGQWIVGDVRYAPPLSYLEGGPLFWLFTVYFSAAGLLALGNIWKARERCLTHTSRQRMTYLLLGFVAPGIGVFPYLIAVSRMAPDADSSIAVLLLSLLGNIAVGFMLLLVGYTVAYFGVLTPDRVVRYRLLRFFMRGPVVAIVVIAAILVVPKVERILGLPRDVVLFGVITGVIIFSQLFLSVTKTAVDRLIYREDRDEIAWLRELDRRLLATTDLRQLLENNLVALCELLRVPSGFVAAAVGPDLMLEAVVGPEETRNQILTIGDWSDALSRSLRSGTPNIPYSHKGFWIWPLADTVMDAADEQTRVFGVLGVAARTDTPLLSVEERQLLDTLVVRVTRALADRKLQQSVLASLRYLIPDIEEVQQLRGVVPYAAPDSLREPTATLMDPSPIHNPEFEAWVKDALSHYWGGPKLTRSPLIRLRVVSELLSEAEDDPTKALRLVLGQAIERLKPEGKQNFTAPEWLLYNILEMRFIQGRKVREIADRLAMSESDLYRKQRVAIGQLARVLTEMEQENGVALEPTMAGATEQAVQGHAVHNILSVSSPDSGGGNNGRKHTN